VAPALPASADGAIDTLDEDAFVAALKRTDPRFERLAAGAALSQADVAAAAVRPNPEIAFDREEVFPDGGIATSYARLSWRLDLAGRRGRRVAAARALAHADAADADIARVALVVDGLRVFHQTAYARLRLELLRTEGGALARAAEIVEKRSRAGASSGYDARRIALELAAYDDLIASAETELLAARSRLGALVGVDAADASSTLELPALPAAPPPAAGDAAVEARGDHRAARRRQDAADALERLADRGWIPDLGVSVGGMAADVEDATAFGYTLGLTLTLPIFDRGQAERARARAIRRLAQADQRLIETQVPRRVTVARETLARRIEQARKLASEQVARLDDLIRSAETGYREGETRVGDLLDAHRAARETRLRDLELRRDARDAELDLWLALGRRP
jgi:cobalt-zinc-cadmium efflux system outer membrane protein